MPSFTIIVHRRAGHDRLADDDVLPAGDAAVRVEPTPSPRARTSGGTSRAACRPRACTAARTGARPPIALATLTAATVKSLYSVGAAAEAAAGHERVQLHLLHRQAGGLGGEHVVEGRELVADQVSSMPSCSHATQFIGSIVAWARNGNS